MNAGPLNAMLIGLAVALLPATAPVPASAEFDNTVRDVQELYKQCTSYDGSLDKLFCLEFVSNVARHAFTNGQAIKAPKNRPHLIKISIRSACPKSSVSNDATVDAFREWANQHIEKWSATAETGVMQAMRDTWPCF